MRFQILFFALLVAGACAQVLDDLTIAKVTPTRTPTPTGTPTPTPTTPAYDEVYNGNGFKHGTWVSEGQCEILPGPKELVAGMSPEFFGNPVSQTCGVCIRVHGANGEAVVRVIDQCAGCPKGTLNLSPEAFDLVSGGPGNKPITWTPVACETDGALYFRFKTSNKNYLALRVTGQAKFLTDVSVLQNGAYVPLKLADYNHWIGTGLGAGPFTVRVTQTDGTVTTVNNLPLINNQLIKYANGQVTILWTPTPTPTGTPTRTGTPTKFRPTGTPTKYVFTPTPTAPKILLPGKTYTGLAYQGGSLVGNQCGNFPVTSESFVAGISSDFFQNGLVCGTCLSVTGPAGTRIIRIVDKFDQQSGSLGLNPKAYSGVIGTKPGPVQVTYSITKCTSNVSAVAFKFDAGSSQYFLSILPVGTQGNVKSLEVLAKGAYQPLILQSYGQWTGSNNDFGKGPYTFRLTYANPAYKTVVFSRVPLAPGKTVSGTLVSP